MILSGGEYSFVVTILFYGSKQIQKKNNKTLGNVCIVSDIPVCIKYCPEQGKYGYDGRDVQGDTSDRVYER